MITIVQGDRYPVLRATLRVDGAAADLTGCKAKLHMRLDGADTLKVNAAASVVTPASGVVEYAWGATDTDTVGWYSTDWEITYADGRTLTWPGGSVRVVPALG